MKIHVNTPDGFRLHLPVPNSLFHSRFLWNTVIRNIRNGQNRISLSDEQLEMLRLCLKKDIKTLNRRFGTLELVNVDTADGTKVRIIL